MSRRVIVSNSLAANGVLPTYPPRTDKDVALSHNHFDVNMSLYRRPRFLARQLWIVSFVWFGVQGSSAPNTRAGSALQPARSQHVRA